MKKQYVIKNLKNGKYYFYEGGYTSNLLEAEMYSEAWVKRSRKDSPLDMGLSKNEAFIEVEIKTTKRSATIKEKARLTP